MHLTERDKDIMRFVLNMKFATVEDIHRKFFRNRRDGKKSTSSWYARERLRDLVESGLIKGERYRFDNKIYYLGTKTGYDLSSYDFRYSDEVAKPMERIDIRTVEHDQKVMQCRLLLEEYDKVTHWQSDRQLKSCYAEYFKTSSRDTCPDGIYKTISGKLIAFEYEIAAKSKKRYEDKIRKYIYGIRSGGSKDGPKYDCVHIVCEKESVKNQLLDLSKIYKNEIAVELADEFFEKFKGDSLKFSNLIHADFTR